MIFEDLIEYKEKLHFLLAKTRLKYWSVEKYRLAMNIPCLCLDLNLQRALFLFKFLADCRIIIEGGGGRRPIILEVQYKLKYNIFGS